MAHNEIRVKKSREDEAVDELTNQLTEMGGCKFLFPQKALFDGLQQLIHGQIKDTEEACHLHGKPVSDHLPEDESEKAIYAERLTQCAWQHFHEQAPAKFQGALAELIQESLPFAYTIYGKRCGFGEEEINKARPGLADLQQNVLRRSILRLKSLPYNKRDGVDGEENNEALSSTARASAEIYNNLAFWTYDHVRVAYFLRDTFLSFVQKHEDPDGEAKFYATEAAEFIWDNIDGAMQEIVNIVVILSLKLAKSSATQRFPESVTQQEADQFRFRASDLLDEVKPFLYLWLNNLSVELGKHGGSEPAADVTDDDCLEFARRYDDLLPVVQEARACYREVQKDKDKLDYGSSSADEVVRERFNGRLGEDVIAQIGFKYPSEITLYEASKRSKLHGYKKRKLEEYLARGHSYLKRIG